MVFLLFNFQVILLVFLQCLKKNHFIVIKVEAYASSHLGKMPQDCP